MKHSIAYEPPALPALVCFDFDGTLTVNDSLWAFLRSMIGIPSLLKAVPSIILQNLSLMIRGSWSAGKAKERVIAACFRGMDHRMLDDLGNQFCREVLPGILRKDVVELMRSYKKNGASVVIVSASIDVWLKPFAEQEGIELICTELAFDTNGLFAGHFATPNCKYEEKVRRLQDKYNLSGFNAVYAFGDSSGDSAMMAMADKCWWIST